MSEAAVNNPGTVGFVAQSIFNDTQLLAHQIGRKTSQGNVYAEVVRTGQIINGRVVDELAFERGGLNDNGEFTFVADFTDGSSGVYKASFGTTAPGVIPQPGIKTTADVSRRDLRTNQTTTNTDTDSAPVPGHAISAAAFGAAPPMAIADGKNDVTGSHLKGASFARSEFSPPVVANLTSAQSSASLITNWVVPNPAPGAGGPTTETILMFVSIDGTLLNEFTESIGPLILPALGSVSLPGAQIAAIAGPRNFPALPLSAEVSYTVNANVNGASSNVFGAYASLRNGDLFLAGDWDIANWDVLDDSTQLKADTNFLGVFSYTVNYDETFALEFVLETFAASNLFGQGSASSDFSNTANFRLTTASGAPLFQLGADGTAVVPLPPAISYLALGLMALIRMRASRTV